MKWPRPIKTICLSQKFSTLNTLERVNLVSNFLLDKLLWYLRKIVSVCSSSKVQSFKGFVSHFFSSSLPALFFKFKLQMPAKCTELDEKFPIYSLKLWKRFNKTFSRRSVVIKRFLLKTAYDLPTQRSKWFLRANSLFSVKTHGTKMYRRKSWTCQLQDILSIYLKKKKKIRLCNI